MGLSQNAVKSKGFADGISGKYLIQISLITLGLNMNNFDIRTGMP